MNTDLNHPVAVVREICAAHPEIDFLELGIYKYRPQSLSDDRRYKQVSPASLVVEFRDTCRDLKADEEIAFHSRVYIGESVLHIPMIDFVGSLNQAKQCEIARVVAEFNCDRVYMFSTGRSYHLYAMPLLNTSQWIAFMGRILLLNLPESAPIVDWRWVGHRLLAGYGALRWTKNTDQYEDLPRRVSGDAEGHQEDSSRALFAACQYGRPVDRQDTANVG
ncbi:MAG: hypothetical protein JWM27_3550 [Gemmatimonadetes bacterium]|nr:hypothetical protein [Gemmatimonadota bacterium]